MQELLIEREDKSSMKIAIGSDQHGFLYKRFIMERFQQHEYIDVGAFSEDPVKYPEFGEKVARMVASGECERGILICGTGIGMAITANKVRGCYAAVCHDIYSAERAVLSNNANILCMGALVIGKKTCEVITEKWLSLHFDSSSHSMANVAMIREIEVNEK